MLFTEISWFEVAHNLVRNIKHWLLFARKKSSQKHIYNFQEVSFPCTVSNKLLAAALNIQSPYGLSNVIDTFDGILLDSGHFWDTTSGHFKLKGGILPCNQKNANELQGSY